MLVACIRDRALVLDQLVSSLALLGGKPSLLAAQLTQPAGRVRVPGFELLVGARCRVERSARCCQLRKRLFPEIAVVTSLELDKPVIAINTATYWYALRQYGIKDKVYGWGSLLAEH